MFCVTKKWNEDVKFENIYDKKVILNLSINLLYWVTHQTVVRKEAKQSQREDSCYCPR